jgi:hypothetical protein
MEKTNLFFEKQDGGYLLGDLESCADLAADGQKTGMNGPLADRQ